MLFAFLILVAIRSLVLGIVVHLLTHLFGADQSFTISLIIGFFLQFFGEGLRD